MSSEAGGGKQILMPSLSGWYGPTEPGSRVQVLDGARPRVLIKKPLIVGAKKRGPGDGVHGQLSGATAYFFATILGITYETFLCLFERRNLLTWFASDEEPRQSILNLAASNMGDHPPGEPMILLGQPVAMAFDVDLEFYEWGAARQCPCAVIPTENGYSKAEDREKALRCLREAILYHGKIFRVGDYPHGKGSLVMIQTGEVWGDAAERLKHRPRRD